MTIHIPGSAATAPSPHQTTSEDAFYVVPDAARPSLDLSKNIVVHFFIARALVAAAIMAPRYDGGAGDCPSLAAVRERVQALSRLFKNEFLFRADASFEEIFAQTLSGMVQDHELVVEGDVIRVGAGDGALQIALYAEIVRSFLESYRIAARGLGLLLRGPSVVQGSGQAVHRARRADVPRRGDPQARSGEPRGHRERVRGVHRSRLRRTVR